MTKKIASTLLLSLAIVTGCFAQVKNRTSVYVKPGTEVHVVSGFSNDIAASSLTLDEESLLYVGGDLNNNGTMNVENDASILRGEGTADGGSGTYNVKQLGATSIGYNYWGTPVVSSGTTPGVSYQFSPANSTQDITDDNNPSIDPGWTTFNGSMTAGRGYAGASAGPVTFSDNAVNNGTLNPSMFVDNYNPSPTPLVTGTPFNLMGNPYPSGLDCSELVLDNVGIHGSLYFWVDDATGGSGYSAADYAIWNFFGTVPNTSGANGSPVPNGFIKTGQGFMLRNGNIGTGNTSLQFNNSQRVKNTASNAFFKPNADDSKLWLSVNGDGSEFFSQILVGATEDATTGEDLLYDAVKIPTNTGASLSAVNDQSKYAVLAFPPPALEEVIPLHVFVGEPGEYVFKADEMIGFQGLDVYFSDTDPTGTSTLLEEGTTVAVNLLSGTYENRFYLNFMPNLTVGIDEADGNSMRAWAFSDLLTIEREGNFEGKSNLQLFDMSGKLVLDNPSVVFNANQTSVSLKGLATGIYVVKVINESSVLSQKFIKR
jgi:hypothetical protein